LLFSVLDQPVETIPAVKPQVVGEADGRGYTLRKLTFAVEPGIVIPALDISTGQSDKPAPATVKIGVDWVRDLATAQARDELVRSYSRIVLANPRGLGETEPGTGSERRGSPFGRDVKEAFLSLHLARPLLGQRVADVLTVLEGLRTESGSPGMFQVVGVGVAGPIALHAALLDQAGLIGSVVLERSLVSWADVVEKGISRNQLGSVVPGALEVYDLPNLAARLAPRPLQVRSPVDAMGQPVAQAQLERAYAACLKAYEGVGRLELHAGPSSESK
jgi:hypothetical protein